MKRQSYPECEVLSFKSELKLAADANSEHGGIVEGYASAFDVRHEGGDRVLKGAFKKTIAERVNKGMVPYLDSHNWDIAHTLGTVSEANEDSKGLHFKAVLSKTPAAQEARQKIAEGHIQRNSIGFVTVRDSYEPYDPDTGEPIGEKAKTKNAQMGRAIHELKMYEISGVPLADDPGAVITGVKAVVPFQDLALADREHGWDAGEARKRIMDWAGGDDKTNWTRYRRAFLWYDREKPDEAGSYKLPIADLTDGGELIAIPRAIFAAAAVMQGARGGGDFGEDAESIRAHLERYYGKMAHQFKDDSIVAPWKKKSIDAVLETARIGVYDLGDIRDAAREFFAVLKPEDRASILAELSAGPPIQAPTGQSDSEAWAALKARGARLGPEIRRRVQ